jgi:hypothetical protein
MGYYLLLIAVLILILIYYQYPSILVKSEIDGRYYRVKNNGLHNQSANLLAIVNKNLSLIKNYVENMNPKPVYYSNLKNFNPGNTHENILNIDTTYTLDKGKFMAFCMGPRDVLLPRLYPINTLMYVAVHELAHIATTSIGHTDEFKRNFADLLEIAIKLNLYSYVDYSKEPVEYCGINLSRSILGSK